MSHYQFEKHFTLEEARALLPELRQIFRDIHRRRDAVRRADEQLRERVAASGVSGLLHDWLQLNRQLRRIQSLGILVKDFDRGLVDFPHLRNGREVFLCWELDEDDIEFWHDLDTGYAGRERL